MTEITTKNEDIFDPMLYLEDFREYMNSYNRIRGCYYLPSGWTTRPKYVAIYDYSSAFCWLDYRYYDKHQLVYVPIETLPTGYAVCFFRNNDSMEGYKDDVTTMPDLDLDSMMPIALATITPLPKYHGCISAHRGYMVSNFKALVSDTIETIDIDDLNIALKILNLSVPNVSIDLVQYQLPLQQWSSLKHYTLLSDFNDSVSMNDYVKCYSNNHQIINIHAGFFLTRPGHDWNVTVEDRLCVYKEQFALDFVTPDQLWFLANEDRVPYFRAFLMTISEILMYTSPIEIQRMREDILRTNYVRYLGLAEYFNYKVMFITTTTPDGNTVVCNCIVYREKVGEFMTVVDIEAYWKRPDIRVPGLSTNRNRGLFQFIEMIWVELNQCRRRDVKVTIHMETSDAADINYQLSKKNDHICVVTIDGLVFDFTRRQTRQDDGAMICKLL